MENMDSVSTYIDALLLTLSSSYSLSLPLGAGRDDLEQCADSLFDEKIRCVAGI